MISILEMLNEEACRELVSMIITNPNLTSSLHSAAIAKKERREVDLVGHLVYSGLEIMFTASRSEQENGIDSALHVLESDEGESGTKYCAFVYYLDEHYTPGVTFFPSKEVLMEATRRAEMLTPAMLSAAITKWAASKTFKVRPEVLDF